MFYIIEIYKRDIHGLASCRKVGRFMSTEKINSLKIRFEMGGPKAEIFFNVGYDFI